MIRALRTTLTVLVAIAVGGFLGRWVYYRETHVVSSYAFVKGAVAQVGAPIEGQVMTVEVRSGQRVDRGDVLLRMNDVRQRAAVDQARAAWQQAVIQVQVAREAVAVQFQKVGVMQGQVKAKIAVGEAQQRAAVVNSKLADKQVERSTVLRDKDMVSEADHDIAAATDEVARETLEQAQGKVDLAHAQMASVALQDAIARAARARLDLLEAAAKTAKAALDTAEAELSMTVVRSPEAGIVSRRIVEPGAGVKLGIPLLELWYDTDLSIEAWIDESKYGDLSVGAPVETTLPGTNHRPYAGHIAWLGVVTELELKDASFSIPIAKILAQSHWVRAKVILDHVDSVLLPGLTVNVSIPRARLEPTPPPAPVPIVSASAAPSGTTRAAATTAEPAAVAVAASHQ